MTGIELFSYFFNRHHKTNYNSGLCLRGTCYKYPINYQTLNYFLFTYIMDKNCETTTAEHQDQLEVIYAVA